MPDIQQMYSNYLRICSWPNGGCIDQHTLVSGHDRTENIRAAIIVAKYGHMVELLPMLHPNQKELRSIWLPDVSENKNPDARIDVRWIADFKAPARHKPIRKASISRLIESAAQQKADIVIINLSGRIYAIQDIKKGIVGAIQPARNKSIRHIWIITCRRNLLKIKREQVYDEYFYNELGIL